MTGWTRLVREPLVGFALFGGLAFGVHALFSPTPSDDHTIRISADEVDRLALEEAERRGRALSDEALQAVVQRRIDEEILARFGRELGLADQDPIIRRRLVQHVQLLADAQVDPPTDEQMRVFVQAHPEFWSQPEAWRLDLRFYGEGPAGERAARRALAAGDPSLGARPLAVDHETGWQSSDALERMLGLPVLDALRGSECTRWCGPIPSLDGYVAVRVQSHRPAQNAELDRVRSRVRQRWMHAERLKARAARLADLRDAYDVVVEWPPDQLASARP